MAVAAMVESKIFPQSANGKFVVRPLMIGVRSPFDDNFMIGVSMIGVRSPFDDNFKPRTATPSSPALATYRQEILCVMVGPWVRIATIGRIGQTET
jgi:hypothetical protein